MFSHLQSVSSSWSPSTSDVRLKLLDEVIYGLGQSPFFFPTSQLGPPSSEGHCTSQVWLSPSSNAAIVAGSNPTVSSFDHAHLEVTIISIPYARS